MGTGAPDSRSAAFLAYPFAQSSGTATFGDLVAEVDFDMRIGRSVHNSRGGGPSVKSLKLLYDKNCPADPQKEYSYFNTDGDYQFLLSFLFQNVTSGFRLERDVYFIVMVLSRAVPIDADFCCSSAGSAWPKSVPCNSPLSP